jgi:competence protein ComEC
MGRRLRSSIVIVAIVVYTILAGAEASVIRAAVMGGVVIIARESGRPSGAAAALGIACWGLLLVEPRMIGDIGLQLSLAATAGLLALGSHAEGAVRRITRDHAPRWFCETLGVSLAAQLSTLPLILLHFGRLSLISPLANLLVAPVVPLAMLGAAMGVLVGPLLATPLVALLMAPLLLASWLPLAAMSRGAGLLAGVPGANVELLPPFDLIGAALAGMALLATLRAVRRRSTRRQDRMPWQPPPPEPMPRSSRRRRRLGGLAISGVLIATVSVVVIARPSPSLQVSVLDVGQGDAILLEASNGDRMLVDGGPDPDLLVRRLDERIPVWDRHIDLAVMTHPHEDHAGGLAGLVPRYSVGRIAETGLSSEGASVRELRAAAVRHGISRMRLVQGDSMTLGGARVDVVWPPLENIPETSPSSGRGINGTSIVLAVSLGQQRILLTGDLEDDRDEDVLVALAALTGDGRRWDLLKVAHHGSGTASSTALLQALRPRLAAISSGVGNNYGHPARSTLGRLDHVGAKVWRTDRRGTLSVALDGRPRSATALLEGPPPDPACPAANGVRRASAAASRDPCYARPDGGTHPNRSALTAHVHLALTTSAAAHDRGGRGGVVPGPSSHARRRRRRSAPGRDCRAPP